VFQNAENSDTRHGRDLIPKLTTHEYHGGLFYNVTADNGSVLLVHNGGLSVQRRWPSILL